MNALAATKAAVTFGWLLAAVAFAGAAWGGAPEPAGAAARPASMPAEAHLKIGAQECAECHGELAGKANVHPAALDCAQCHEYSETPEAEEGRVRLAGEGAALCFTCHAETQKALETKKFSHMPAQGECTLCHDPHSSDNERLLKGRTQELCATCHEETGERIGAAKFVHAPIKEHGCAACHDPHASDAAQMLKAEPEALCMSCHRWEESPNPKNRTRKRILATSDGRGHPVTGHPYTGAADPSAEGKKITCLSCHDSHSGAIPSRLRPGKVKDDFCSRCH